MATQATIGKWVVEIDTADTETPVYAPIEEVRSLSGVGATKATVEVTNFDSPELTKEFIPGLAEGEQISVECNYIHDATVQTALQSGAADSMPMKVTYDTSSKVYEFRVSYEGWALGPSISDANTISFTFKISGGFTIT
jgi:hypothetical protein